VSHHYAITVPQPWANAVFAPPGSRVEVLARPKSTDYRGRLYIHAGMSYDEAAPSWVRQAAPPGALRGWVLGCAELDAVEEGDGAWLWYLARPEPLAIPGRTHGWGGLWIIPEPDAKRMLLPS
jgi:hypothetical protein